MRSRHLSLLAAAALLLTACAPDVDLPQDSGLGSSGLAPSIAPEPGHRAKTRDHAKHERTKKQRRAQGRPGAGSTQPAPRATSRPVAQAAPPSAVPAQETTPAASVSDPSGDVRGSLAGAPSYVDLTRATLTRTADGYELRVGFAGAVPAEQGGDGTTVNVASFYDLDGDGQVDYEVWATLADDGWSGSYRYPSGARYGADSGVSARPDGHDLVVRFPLEHLRRAEAFRWSVGAEWGSYEQVASGTTARDTAPDSGVTRFPG